ncbi:MAG TPA: choice-of-anchor Q domain-containing protein, partial [Candidatus Binatia bacterium]
MNTAIATLKLLAASRGHRGGVQGNEYIFPFAVTLLVMVAAQVTSAATITVNTTADNLTAGDGQCTLREALANVNAAADTTSGDCTAGTGAGDTVTFSLVLPVKITLVLGELVIQRDVTIMGPTAGTLRISGAHTTRVLHITTITTVSVSNLTIENGNAPYGGGIWNGSSIGPGGTVALTDCTFTGNKAQYGGGGIYNGSSIGPGGTVALTNCTFTGNKAQYDGGAIENDGTMSLTNCTLKNNRAIVSGAGISNANAGTMTLLNCTLTGNVAISGPFGGHLGGGISNDGTMTLRNCTLNGNSGDHGGGIYNETGTMSLTNSTLTGNYARWGAGGGIMNLSALALTNCTISRNKAYAGPGSLGGGGIWQNSELSPATIVVTNTIIAGNGKAGNCGGAPPTSNGHNLSDAGCFTSGGTDLVNTDPVLAPLAKYGGPTKTMALCAGAHLPSRSCKGASPAIDAGDDGVTGPPLNLTTDQRGLPRLSGAHVDIGA